jgi:transcriptional regulator with XRE-family HTH domain
VELLKAGATSCRLLDVYGSYIRREREKRGYSVAEAAARIGVSADAVYKYESDKNSPSLDTLDRIAAAFGCLVGDLLPNSGGGALAGDFEPLQAALSGLTRGEMQDYILMMASQARLFRNAVLARSAVTNGATLRSEEVASSGNLPVHTSVSQTLLTGGITPEDQENAQSAPLGNRPGRKGDRK